VLIASLSAVIGMIVINGLPKPYHPVFNVSRFARASHDRFFLCIPAGAQSSFDLEKTSAFLRNLNAYEVTTVDA
jgi:hypothetical protein